MIVPTAPRRLRLLDSSWIVTGVTILFAQVALSLVVVALEVSGVALLVLCIGLLVASALIVRPMVAAVVAFPAVFVYLRVGPTAVDLSVADAATVIGIGAALSVSSGPATRRLLGVSVAYALILGVTVVAHPQVAVIAEWGHRLVLVAGAIVVGGAVAGAGYAHHALRALYVAAVVVASSAFVIALGNGFSEAAYPLGLQKNAAGALLAMTFLLATTASQGALVRPWMTRAVQVLAVLGLLAVQSRASMLALALTVGIIALRRGPRRTVSVGWFVVAGALAVYGWQLLQGDDNRNTRFGSIGSREIANDLALERWQADQLFGAGMRWFKDAGVVEPHNMVTSGLSESGLVGMFALAVLLTGSWLVLRRLDTPLATAATTLLVFRVVEGNFGIFWVAGTQTLLWLVVGLAAGLHDGAEQHLRDETMDRELAYARRRM